MSLSCMRFFVFVIFLYRFLTGGVYFSPYDQQTVFLKIMMSLNMRERGRSRGMFEVPLFGRVVLFVFFFFRAADLFSNNPKMLLLCVFFRSLYNIKMTLKSSEHPASMHNVNEL